MQAEHTVVVCAISEGRGSAHGGAWRPVVLRLKAFVEILKYELSFCERQMFCSSRALKNKHMQLISKYEFNFSLSAMLKKTLRI